MKDINAISSNILASSGSIDAYGGTKNGMQVGKIKDSVTRKKQSNLASDNDLIRNELPKARPDLIQISSEAKESSNRRSDKGTENKKSTFEPAGSRKKVLNKKVSSAPKHDEQKGMAEAGRSEVKKNNDKKDKKVVKKGKSVQTRIIPLDTDKEEAKGAGGETTVAEKAPVSEEQSFLDKLFKTGKDGKSEGLNEDEFNKFFTAGPGGKRDPEIEKYLRSGAGGERGTEGAQAVNGVGPKTEAATAFQNAQQDGQNAASILMELAAQRMKWQMQIWQIIQELQTSIMEIVQSVLLNRAQTMDKIHQAWTSVIRGGSSSS